jgi:hypothetical protein
MPLAVRRFTVDEYHRMGQAGVLHEDDRVELIHGQIVTMTPVGDDHLSCVNRLHRLFASLAHHDATPSVQNPVVLDQHEEPQPDFTLLRFRQDGYKARRPGAGDALLVIEVGDSSAAYDRKTKMPLYAEAGIPEAWLVDLPDDTLEVYREPRGGRYHDVRTARRGGTVSPLAFPGLVLQVDDVLGPLNP